MDHQNASPASVAAGEPAAKGPRIPGGWSPGAAGLYKAAELAACPAYTAMVATGTDPAAVGRAMGVRAPSGQAPTAIARGIIFEHSLGQNNGRRLQELLARRERYATRGLWLVDLDRVLPLPSDPGPSLAAALRNRAAAVAGFVRDRADGLPAPDVILQGDLTAELGGMAFRVRPDLLLSPPGARSYGIGEIKGWADLGPGTDPGSLAAALGQVAVGHLALSQLPGPPPRDEATLVLADGATLSTTVRELSLDREREVLARYAPVLRAAHGGTATGPTTPQALLAHGTRLTDACRSRCPLYAHCRARARDDDDPAVLGSRAAAQLGPLGLGAAADAALGAVPPTGDGATDKDHARTLTARAGAAWRRAVHW